MPRKRTLAESRGHILFVCCFIAESLNNPRFATVSLAHPATRLAPASAYPERTSQLLEQVHGGLGDHIVSALPLMLGALGCWSGSGFGCCALMRSSCCGSCRWRLRRFGRPCNRRYAECRESPRNAVPPSLPRRLLRSCKGSESELPDALSSPAPIATFLRNTPSWAGSGWLSNWREKRQRGAQASMKKFNGS